MVRPLQESRPRVQESCQAAAVPGHPPGGSGRRRGRQQGHRSQV